MALLKRAFLFFPTLYFTCVTLKPYYSVVIADNMSSAQRNKICFFFTLWAGCLVNVLSGQVGDTISTVIYFDTDQYGLRKNHQEQLEQISHSIGNDYIIDKVVITGYADRRGGSRYNQVLSEKRASSISSYLLSTYPNLYTSIHSSALGSSVSGDQLRLDRRVDIAIFTHPKEVKAYGEAIEIQDLATITEDLLEPGTQLKIANLNFQPGRSILRRSSIPQLKKLEELMHGYPNLHIRIEGHICCKSKFDGDTDGRDIDILTDNLSEERAKNIYAYLIKKGIKKERLSYIGYGHSRPHVFPEKTERDRILNRRVEILILK